MLPPPPSPDALLAALDPEQRAVAETLVGPVCVVAGAGTGKTRAITHRIAHGVATGAYAPAEVLAVTFTTRAAGEMRSRLTALGAPGVQVRTFHAAALRQARYFWPKVYGGELPELATSKLPFLGEAVRRQRIRAEQALLRDLAGEIEWAKVSNVRPDDYPRLAPGAGRVVAGLDAASVGLVFAAYEEVKRERVRIDMEDLLLVALALLDDDDRVAAQVRRQYRWFTVDEYQDVSPVQVALLQRWLGDRDDLCVVGDPWQTIYTFAGASTTHLAEFGRRFQGATRLSLVRNYRSTPQVVALANAVATTTTRAPAPDGVTLRAQRDAGPEVVLHGSPDEVVEADWVAAELDRRRRAGTELRDMAVLVRINAQTRSLEEALGARGLAYTLRGAHRFFDRSEVRQAVTLLRGAARAGPGAGDGEGEGLVATTLGVLAAMNHPATPPAGGGQVRDRWESLHALVGVAEELVVADPGAALPGLVAELDRRADVQDAPVAQGITLATLHAAKGLEWDVVVLAGMHEGAMPIVHATTAAAVDEERRLFYVGITRARRELLVSWASARTPGGRGNRSPTRFLDSVIDRSQAAGRAATAGPRRRAKTPSHCRGCGRALRGGAQLKVGRCAECPPSYDEAVFARLRDWRREQAAQQHVPAYCVLTDATLTAIAEQMPSDAAGLARIAGVGRVKLERYGSDLLAQLRPAQRRLDDSADNGVARPVTGRVRSTG
ncbi:MAG: ATP-dependent DNA helicase UvrD2 [Nocardioidaceae bacterium]|nr:ATP-dependent DNA helicase UvrD2 [Nocardioidaceae bacterium]